MIEWGSLELPELDYWRGSCEVGKHHPATGLIHRSTGLGATHASLRYEERGLNRELLIYAPPGEEWLLRLRITGEMDCTAVLHRILVFARLCSSNCPPKESGKCKNGVSA